MKIVIAQMNHETNTFSPVPTPISRFARANSLPLEGEAAITAIRGTGTAIGAFIELAEQAGATMDDIVTSVKEVTGIIAEITAASEAQHAGIQHALHQWLNPTDGNQFRH